MASDENIVRQLVAGKLKLHELSEKIPAEEAINVRRKFVEEKTKTTLNAMANYSFDANSVSVKNTENLIGAIHVPVGIAGPLKVSGDYAKGEFLIPLATTEGALVASVSRGAKAITESGGATAFVENVGVTRAPVFRTSGLNESRELAAWVQKNFSRIKSMAESTTRFGELKKIKHWICGKNVYLRFVFDTKDAMGMNMATIACDKVVRELIEKETNAECAAISGNMCADKKPSYMNMIKGRGKIVHAEAVIPAKIAEKILKAKPEQIVGVNYRKNLLGSAMAGSMGYNAHFANIVAAIFIATGQDPAHVVEGSIGITAAEMQGKDLYISIYMPSVELGTVGGGTGLATQKEALSILGCAGATQKAGENTLKLAEIVGAAVLAGELSLLAALASGQMAAAHAKLGRGVK